MSTSFNCLTCANWARTDDKLVGLCVVHQGYRFQLENCAAYAFGEARERSAFTELPKLGVPIRSSSLISRIYKAQGGA